MRQAESMESNGQREGKPPWWEGEGDFGGSKKGEKKLTLIYGRHFAGVANPAHLATGMEKQFRKELKKK